MSRRRKWSKQELIRNLEILGNLDDPLPPTLPPSPPASRSSSPVIGTKRKSDDFSLQEHSKRPRTGAASLRQSQSHHTPSTSQPSSSKLSTQVPVYPLRSEPEDGEVREDSLMHPVPPSVAGYPLDVPNAVPVRRPKRGRLPPKAFEQVQELYYKNARLLKYSGDARFWSTYPPFHKEYRPLNNPPPPNSLYHQHGGLIARLELVDALVCFTYSLWIKDYIRHTCYNDSWDSISGFLGWCRSKWEAGAGTASEAEKGILGLIWMIESFIHARKITYTSRAFLEPSINKVVDNTQREIAAAIASAEQQFSSGHLDVKSHATPQMLPSPASIVTANSANSTPTSRDDASPPTAPSANISNTSDATGPPVPLRLLPQKYAESALPVPPHVVKAANSVTPPIDLQLVAGLKDLMKGIKASAWSSHASQQSLTLPIMAKHFPRTFARMVHSSLSAEEEHEPDFEDEEGELFWPGQSVDGEGLGWVCLMGQAMIREFGKPYGYQGIKGVVLKPERPDQVSEHGSVPPESSRCAGGSTPSHAPSSSRSSAPSISHQRMTTPVPGHLPNPSAHALPPRPNFVQYKPGGRR